jgi:hypothetical protein
MSPAQAPVLGDAPSRLVAAVQANCHVADARHAGDLPLCIYLLQLREFYRWERGLPFGAELPRAEVGAWIAEREGLWDRLGEREIAALPCAGGDVDAFDVDAVNRSLHGAGWRYGAGLTGPGRPVFFVAELVGAGPVEIDGEQVEVEVCGRELARGLYAPLAVLAQGPKIVLRRAALARWLWEHFEGHGMRPGSGPFAELARAYGLADSAGFNAALPSLLDELSPVLLLHEVGELRAGRSLDPAWGEMRMAQAGDRRTELRLRALRDLLADLGTTLPALLDADVPARLHFWFAGYEGYREAMFPGLPRAYAAWRAGDGGRALRQAAEAGLAHFQALAAELLALAAREGEAVARRLDHPSIICLA